MLPKYYLSTYMHIDELAHTSENYYRHDHNFSLWTIVNNQAKLIHYCELERISRIKQHKYACYSKAQAVSIINDVISQYGLTFDDLHDVWGTPEISTIDIQKLHDNSCFNEFPIHSIAHAFSGLKLASDTKVLCLSIDQGPDNILKSSFDYKSHYLGTVYKDSQVLPPIAIQSPAPVWFELSEISRLKEGTLMALGSASNCELKDPELWISRLMDIKLFNANDLSKLKAVLSSLYELVKLPACEAQQVFSNPDKKFTINENYLSAIVKVVQQYSIRVMEVNIRNLVNKFCINPEEYSLCITGGYALNCPTNTYLMKKFGFKEFVSPPCVSDTGMSLGYAQYYFYLNGIKSDGLTSPYFGNNTTLSIKPFLEKYSNDIKSIRIADPELIANDIIAYPIVWFHGRSEVGPRALGHRSILADPRASKSKDILNQIKQRQWWRPVAPIVLESEVSNWFDDAQSSQFMLQTFKVNKEKQEQVPAVLHLDNSARVQTLNMDNDNLLYSVLSAFYKKTGVPILCNTSLNDRGEPIIDSLDQAIVFALRKAIPVLYVENIRIELTNFEKYSEVPPLAADTPFRMTSDERNATIQRLNPVGISDECLQFYFDFPDVQKSFCLTKVEDVIALQAQYVKHMKEFESSTNSDATN